MKDSSQPPYFMDLELIQRHQRGFDASMLWEENDLVFNPGSNRGIKECRNCHNSLAVEPCKVGGLVIASCFHPNTRGPGDDPMGVEFEYASDSTSLNHGVTGWRAIVEPIGKMVWVGYEADGRRATPDVLIREVVAFCYNDNPYRVETNPTRLTEGFLMASHLNKIVPVCRPEHSHYRNEMIFGRFRIEGGKPLLLPMVD